MPVSAKVGDVITPEDATSWKIVSLSGTSSRCRSEAFPIRAELLQQLEEGLAKSRKALENTNEAHLNTTWRLKMGDQVLTEGPRYVMIADGALSHLAHHRGQLTVYLRLKESKVPAIYGPSADEWH